MHTLKQGFLISIEGIDGAGKSTLAQILFNHFSSFIPAILTKEPGATELGKQLRPIVQACSHELNKKAEFLLFAADRAEHFNKILIPAYQKGTLIISDRLHDSSLAYQGYGRGLDLSIITTINEWVMSGLQPDMTIYLKIDQETIRKRLKNRKILSSFDQESNEFFEKVIKGFEIIFATRKNVFTIDASLPLEAILKHVIPPTEHYLKTLYE